MKARRVMRPASENRPHLFTRASRFINRILCPYLIIPLGALCSSRSELAGLRASVCVFPCAARSGMHRFPCAGRGRSGKDFFSNRNQGGQRGRIRASRGAWHSAGCVLRDSCPTADVRECSHGGGRQIRFRGRFLATIARGTCT